jgi:hypothetical protein
MQRIERKSLTKPISKDNLQASTLNQRFDFNFQELRNTVTSEADCVNGRNIAEHQLCVRVDLDFFAALLESPFAGAPGFRVPKINQTMIAFLNASLDDIAKDADVGAGTLYRHFPTRDALIEAVYGTEVEKLAAAERKFTEAMPPIEALRAGCCYSSITSRPSRSSPLHSSEALRSCTKVPALRSRERSMGW